MPRNLVDLSGQKFGRLTVISRASSDANGNARWNCLCECGGSTTSLTWALRSAQAKSCGCHKEEQRVLTFTKHGLHGTSEYWSWAMMIQRCTNPKNDRFAHYGGRGIAVHQPWRKSFETFLSDMGKKPTPQHTLERKNTNGNYSPSNCKWATKREQNLNKRDHHWVRYRGKRMCITAAIELAAQGLHLNTVMGRIGRGWPTARAVETPPDPRFTARS